jgi:pimeloyl-ACP methyl ester carboxylesterase
MTGQVRVAIRGSGEALAHPDDVVSAHRRVLAGSPARSRYVEIAPGRRVHVIEAGEGPPLVLIHGSGPTGLLFLPLLERLNELRAIAVDRPGFGLSDSIDVDVGYRRSAVQTVGRILDAMGLDEVSLLGNSTGGTWAMWYGLARPERVRRLVLLGALPLLPSTHVPPPLLAVAAPTAGQPPPQMPRPSWESVVRSMGVFGEAETIVNYPDQIEALIAAGQDEVATAASLGELRTLISPSGWPPELVVSPDELRALTMPTLLIWGDHDPLGGAAAAQMTVTAIPHARLELLSAGHAPWLGHLDQIAALVSDFLR